MLWWLFPRKRGGKKMAVVDMPSEERGAVAPRLVQRRGSIPWSRRLATSRIIHAHSEDRLLTWSYTGGLLGSYGHPEFLLTGLDPFLAESVLSQLAERVSFGHIYTEANLQKDLLHQLTCAFREVPADMATVLMPQATNLTSGNSIRALQCIYPDNHNRLPWHLGYNSSWHEVQPLFTAIVPLSKVELNLLRAAAELNRASTEELVEQL